MINNKNISILLKSKKYKQTFYIIKIIKFVYFTKMKY